MCGALLFQLFVVFIIKTRSMIHKDYLTAEDFDLMFEDELDFYYAQHKKLCVWEEYEINQKLNNNENAETQENA